MGVENDNSDDGNGNDRKGTSATNPLQWFAFEPLPCIKHEEKPRSK